MKKIFISTVIMAVLFLFNLETYAQLSFTNEKTRLTNPSFHSGVAIGVMDVNSDGLDDIIIGFQWNDPNGNSDAGNAYIVFGFATD